MLFLFGANSLSSVYEIELALQEQLQHIPIIRGGLTESATPQGRALFLYAISLEMVKRILQSNKEKWQE